MARISSEEQPTAGQLSAGQLSRVLDSIADGFVVLDKNWRFAYLNSTAERINNRPRSEMLGRNHWDLFPDTVGTEIEDEYRRAVAEQTVREFETYYEPWRKWFRVRCYPGADGGLIIYFLDVTESKRANEENERLIGAVQESQDRLSALVTATTAILWTTSANGHFVTPQPSWEAYTGQRWPDYAAGGGAKMVHPDDQAAVRAAWKGSLHGKSAYEVESRLWHAASGEFRMTKCRAVPVMNADGSVREWVGAYEDIHDRRLAEQRSAESNRAMRESEERYRFLAEAIPQFVWIADGTGTITYVNHHWSEYTGLTWDGSREKGWTWPVHPDDRERVVGEARRSAREGIPFDTECRLRRADGAYRWHLARARRFPSEGGGERWLGTAVDIHDRRETEAALRESEERFRKLAESMPGPIFVTNAAGLNTYTNRHFQDYSGLTAEELLGDGWLRVIHPEDQQRADAVWKEAVRSEQSYYAEYRFRNRDGDYRWKILRGEPVRDCQENIVSWVGVGLDVEDQKRAEASLRASEERFRSIVEASAEGIWMVGKDTLTTFVNRRMTELLGYSAEELMGRSCFDFIHPEDKERGIRGFDLRKDAGEIGAREYRFQRKDGALVWLSFIGSRMYDASGTLTGVLAMCTDTTDRRRIEERIRELNAELTAKLSEFETLLSVAPVGIAFSYDVQCGRVKLNPEAQRIMGVDGLVNASKTGPDADRLPYRWMRDGVEVAGENLPLQVAARTGTMVNDVDYDVVHPDGRTTPVICSARPLLDERGDLRGAVAAILDISERKNMENALRRANVALEQFAYAAAHDLQEPVRNVTLYTQLLSRQYQGRLDAQATDMMKLTVEGARRMQNLIQDLLSYTKATDEFDGGQASADSGAALEEVLQNLKTAIEQSEAVIVCGELPRVGVRHGQMVQLFQNLVSNAIKYRGTDAPRIHVGARQQGREWVFTVSDNGQGIAPEHHDRIFRIFKRLHGQEISGTGIGLAICERIVTHYGGRIWVESERGGGAAFHFTLPAGSKFELAPQ